MKHYLEDERADGADTRERMICSLWTSWADKTPQTWTSSHKTTNNAIKINALIMKQSKITLQSAREAKTDPKQLQ